MAAKYPSIQSPTADPVNLRDAMLAAKETLETLTRQRGSPNIAAVTWGDLVSLGLISAGQIPSTPTSPIQAQQAAAAVVIPPPKSIVFTRVLSVASGTQSVTGVGFKPSAVLFIASIIGGNGWGSVGWADAALSNSLEIASNTTIQSLFFQPGSAGIIRDSGVSPGGAANGVFVLTTMDVDGFTLTWTKSGSPTATATIGAMCFP